MHPLVGQSIESIALMGLLALGLWIAHQRMKRQSDLVRRQLEERARLLERFQDADAFVAFVATEEGRRLLLDPPAAPPPGLRMLQAGTLSLPAGVALFNCGRNWLFRVKPQGDFLDAHFAFQGQRAELLGGLLIAVGLGLLAGGLLTWRLTRRG